MSICTQIPAVQPAKKHKELLDPRSISVAKLHNQTLEDCLSNERPSKTNSTVTHTICLNGPFSISRNGAAINNLTSRKSIALLAILATSPKYKRSRNLLIDMLWGSRDRQQALSSLRQELLNLRRKLNAEGDIIFVSRDYVWLNSDLVSVEQTKSSTFLEGLHIPGEAKFARWLGEYRPETSHRPSSLLQPSHLPQDRVRLQLDLQGSQHSSALPNSAEHLLRLQISQGFQEFGGVDVVTDPETAPDLKLTVTIYGQNDFALVTASLISAVSGRVLLTTQRRLSTDLRRITELFEELGMLANETVERSLSAIAQNQSLFSNPNHVAARLSMAGVSQFFSRLPGAAEVADNNFAAAAEISSDSAFFAWRAYLSALFLEERPPEEHDGIRERAVYYARRAMELDPHNGLSMALLTHVHAFVLRDFDRAGSFLERALTVKPDHVMTQDAAALLNFYTGDLYSARAAAFKAERLGNFLPYRYCFATTQGMIETMAGNFNAGIRHGERAAALMPIGKIKPYPPTLRYLGVCYAQTGQIQKAQLQFSHLEAVQGELRATDVDSRNYPVPSTTAAKLMRQSLQIIGK
jgi:tetratricopeptide (TPR) repeat protein